MRNVIQSKHFSGSSKQTHSRSQSCDPLGQRHGSRALARANFAVRDSRTSGQLRSRKVYKTWSVAKMAGQRTIDIFHEALNFGLQLLGAGHLQLKEKQYEVLKVCSY